MLRRDKLLIGLGSGSLFIAVSLTLLHLHQRKEPGRFEIIPQNQTLVKIQGRDGLSSGKEAAPWAYMRAFQATNAVLRTLSTNNVAFQDWGKGFMLRVCNDHLSKVPLFGLKRGSLRPEDVVVTSYLTLNGAEFDLATTDRKHSIYYQRGVLVKAVAHQGCD